MQNPHISVENKKSFLSFFKNKNFLETISLGYVFVAGYFRNLKKNLCEVYKNTGY